ncbi:Npt1/Npt2 family nucleotide transporter [Nitrospira sp. Kam-Ns4a]
MFLLIAAYVVMKSVRDSLFLYKLGVAQLPLVYILVAVFSGLVAWLYARGFRRLPISAQLHTTFFAGAAVLLMFRLALSGGAPWLYYALYLWVSGYGLLTVAQSWLFANQVFTTREAKRLFGVIGAGAILGGTLGGLLTTSLAALVGTEGLLLVAAGGYAACSGIVAVLDRMTRASVPAPTEVAEPQAGEPFLGSFAGYGRHLAMIAGLIALGEVVAILVDYQFKAIIREAYPSKDALTAFLGAFYAGLGVVSFLVQLLTTGFVVQTLGLSAVLLSLPVTLLAGSLAVAVSPGFTPVAFLKLSEGSFRYSINKAGLELLYVPLPWMIKTKAKAFIDSVTERTAGGIGGLILLVATGVFSFTVFQLSVVVIGLLAIWIPLAALSQQRYLRALRAGLQAKYLDSWQAPVNLSEARTVSLLTRRLLEADEVGTLAVLRLLERADVTPYVPALMELARRPGSLTRAAAIHLLTESRDVRALPLMENAIRDPDLTIRVNAMRFVCAVKGCPDTLIEGWLASQDPRVLGGAVVCALGRAGDPLHRQGEQVLAAMASAGGPDGKELRLEAARALGWIGFPSYVHSNLLISLLRDPDLTIVKAALRSAAQVKPPEAAPTIIATLLRNAVAGEAGDTLARYGPPVLPLLDRAYADPRQPIELRRRLPRVVATIGGPEAVVWLIRRLDEPDRVARYHVVKALNKLRAGDTSLVFDPPPIEQRLLIEIREYEHLLAMRQRPVPDETTPGSRLFRQALAERAEDHLKLIFRLLGLLFPIKDIHDAYYGLRASDARVRDYAVEFLDSMLPPPLKQALIPLIDRRVSTALRDPESLAFDSDPVTFRAGLAAVARGRDPWLASCALYIIGEQQMEALQEVVHESLGSPDSLVRETAGLAWRHLTRRLEIANGKGVGPGHIARGHDPTGTP